MSSKSANYCFANQNSQVGLLLLCEVSWINRWKVDLNNSDQTQHCLNAPALCVCLCVLQVALGDSNELLDADYEANNLPPGKHSTKGLGQTGPDPENSVTLLVCLITFQALHRRCFYTRKRKTLNTELSLSRSDSYTNTPTSPYLEFHDMMMSCCA